jgi:hypothetical protein
MRNWLQRKAKVDCRREAREDFDFEAGDQRNEETQGDILTDAKRPWRRLLAQST